MGNSLDCACFESVINDSSSHADKEAQERLAVLKRGNTFLRSAMLGLTNQELSLNLSDDTSKIEWKVTKGKSIFSGGEEHGEIDLTENVKTIKLFGAQGLQFISIHDGKVLMELIAEEVKIRDQWVLALNELLQSWIEKPDLKPKSSISASGTSNKAEYFRKREEELEAREKAAAEKKAKYSAGGMKMTAQIMANRPG